MRTRDIIVVGGSTGASEVLVRMVGELPADLGAALFINTHIPAEGLRALGPLLQRATMLPVRYPEDGDAIVPDCIYLPSPDRHLVLVDGVVRHGFGPRENMVRPAIDPLFRSAAADFGPRVIGVVLSGLLNDGASGLEAIASRGGVTIVQDPETASAPDMPRAACRAIAPDYVAPPERLAELIAGLTREEAAAAGPAPDLLLLEVEIALGRRLGSERLQRLATPAPLTCPDCQGVLSEVREGRTQRFRCQTGHAFTAEVLYAANDDRIEEALRIALRIVEERVELVTRMGDDARRTGRTAVASLYEGRTREYSGYAETLREAAIHLRRTVGEGER